MQTFQIDKLVAGGLGLARDESGVVLVAGALPGEVVRADVRPARGVRRAVTREVVEASADRVPGLGLPTADLSHAAYPAQLAYKRGFVQEALSRIAKLDGEIGETVPSPQELGYRGGAQYLVHDGKLAYRERAGHAPVDVASDPLVMAPIADFLARLDAWGLGGATELVLRGSRETGEVLAALVGEGGVGRYRQALEALLDAGAAGVSLAKPAGRRFSSGARLLSGEPSVLERFGDLLLSVSATGFAQVNPPAAGELYRAAARLAGEGGHAVDLYGGAGGLGLHLAPGFARVTILDASGEALKRGEGDARRLQIANVAFSRGDAADLPPADVVVVDPPRAGLEPEVRAAIDDSPAARLVYVSCDPATWARDVGEFVRAGWRLESAVPHDFYPQTSHVEVLSLLTR